jgi:hypothetical protein
MIEPAAVLPPVPPPPPPPPTPSLLAAFPISSCSFEMRVGSDTLKGHHAVTIRKLGL